MKVLSVLLLATLLLNATMVNGWALFAAKVVYHGTVIGINIYNEATK